MDASSLRTLGPAEVEAILGSPADLVRSKVQPALDANLRAFIARSPFLSLATFSAAGDADVSPRGDPAGVVRVLDDRTLAIPERPGNKLADSLYNILETGSVGLLFVIPGIEDTVRVNGRATITDDPELLDSLAVGGKRPKLALVVHVHEAYVHCAKAFKRSHLWDPERFADRSEVPSLGQIIKGQVELPEMTAADVDAYAEDAYRTELY
jgi:PPOX class probable FMN-dependent enzyme